MVEMAQAEVRETEISTARAHAMALQAQINPHFFHYAEFHFGVLTKGSTLGKAGICLHRKGTDLEGLLEPAGFLRISRGELVNIDMA